MSSKNYPLLEIFHQKNILNLYGKSIFDEIDCFGESLAKSAYLSYSSTGWVYPLDGTIEPHFDQKLGVDRNAQNCLNNAQLYPVDLPDFSGVKIL